MPTERRELRLATVASQRTRFVTVLLDNIHDAHNVSAVLRTADAAGILTIHALATTSPIRISPKVARGAKRWIDFRIHSRPVDAIAALRKDGYRILAGMPAPMDAVAPQPISIWDWAPDARTAFVLGNEHAGISSDILAAADGTFTIPQRGFVESLNISVAAALVMMIVRHKLERAQPSGWQLSEIERGALYDRWLRRELGVTGTIEPSM